MPLPDPPLLFAGGCHGPYFPEECVVELETDGKKIIGLGETTGNQAVDPGPGAGTPDGLWSGGTRFFQLSRPGPRGSCRTIRPSTPLLELACP